MSRGYRKDITPRETGLRRGRGWMTSACECSQYLCIQPLKVQVDVSPRSLRHIYSLILVSLSSLSMVCSASRFLSLCLDALSKVRHIRCEIYPCHTTITRREVARGQEMDHRNFCHKNAKPGPVIYSINNYACVLSTLTFLSSKNSIFGGICCDPFPDPEPLPVWCNSH